MGDSNSAGAKAIHRSGSNTAASIAVKAAFTREGTQKKGVSKAVLERAKTALRQFRNRKLAGRSRRKANAATRAQQSAERARSASTARNAERQALNRARLRGD